MNIAYVSSEVAEARPIDQAELDALLWLIGKQLAYQGPKAFVSVPISSLIRLLKTMTEAEKQLTAAMLAELHPEGVKDAPAPG